MREFIDFGNFESKKAISTNKDDINCSGCLKYIDFKINPFYYNNHKIQFKFRSSFCRFLSDLMTL